MNREEREGREGPAKEVERLASIVVDAGSKVHRSLGPGLLESAYEACLAHELTARGLLVSRQVALPVIYDGIALDAGYRLDILVNDLVIIEVNSIFAAPAILAALPHAAQPATRPPFARLAG